MTAGLKSAVVVATFNERENLPALLGAIAKLSMPLDVLVVDDNSPDGTGEIADLWARQSEHVRVLHRRHKSGLASALSDGFFWAIERRYAHVVNMDADLSHDPAAIPLLLRTATQSCNAGDQSPESSGDLVLGSRYLNRGRVVNWVWRRLILSLAAAHSIRAVTGMPFHDPTSGFRCYSRRALQWALAKPLLSQGYSVHIEMAHRIWRAGMRIVEVPISYRSRQHGRSKLNGSIIWEALWITMRLAWQSRHRPEATLVPPVAMRDQDRMKPELHANP